MLDLRLEDDRAELRRVQNREQPELLAGSLLSDDFNSLLITCGITINQQVENGEIRATDQNLCTSLQVADGNAEALRSCNNNTS